jgi:N,N-dimethylformamidase
MYQLDPTRTDLALEFKARPYGRHSAELQRILNLFRSTPLAHNWCLVCRQPHAEWVLARFGATARDPVEIFGPVFTSMAEAEWHVFKLRWEQFSGEELALG